MFQFEVESFTLHNKDLQPLLISEDEWDAIKLVYRWLLNFCEATRHMSTTLKPIFGLCMPFFVAFKMPSNQFMQIFHLLLHANSRLAFSMLTEYKIHNMEGSRDNRNRVK